MIKNYIADIKKSNLLWLFIFLFSLSFLAISCVYKKPNGIENPKGYNLSKPDKFNMPEVLLEISGVTFNKGKNDYFYAHQDEDGSVFKIPVGSKDYTETKFNKKGDYEDIAMMKEQVFVLKSNGAIYAFSINELDKSEANNVVVTENVLPKAEYEGMFADEISGNIYVLCKNCKEDKGSKKSTGYILTLQKDNTLKLAGNFSIDVSEIDQISGKKKGAFRPSALAINPLTSEWYIISSVNKVLIVADSKFKIKDVFHLNGNTFNQPEGIAFDSIGNLYISNEGSETQEGNVLRFNYTKS